MMSKQFFKVKLLTYAIPLKELYTLSLLLSFNLYILGQFSIDTVYRDFATPFT